MEVLKGRQDCSLLLISVVGGWVDRMVATAAVGTYNTVWLFCPTDFGTGWLARHGRLGSEGQKTIVSHRMILPFPSPQQLVSEVMCAIDRWCGWICMHKAHVSI